MAPQTTLYRLTDLALDGRLEELLRKWRDAGLSVRAASKLLVIELGGIEISFETVRSWVNALEDPNGEAAA